MDSHTDKPVRFFLGTTNVRVIFLSLAFAICILAAIGIVAFNQYAANIRQQTAISLKDILSEKHHAVDRFIDERQGDAAIISSRLTLLNYFSTSRTSADIENLHQLISKTREVYGYSRILLVNRNLAAIWPKQVDPNKNIQIALQRAIKTGAPQFVDIFLGNDGQTYWGLTQPISLQAGNRVNIVGAIYLEISVDKHIYPIISTWPTQSGSAESLLLRQEGDEALYLTPLRNLPGVSPLSVRRPMGDEQYVAVQSLSVNSPSIIKGKDYRGIEVIGAAMALPETNWILQVKVDQEEIDRPIRRFGWIVFSILLAVILLILIIAWLAWKVRHAATEQKLIADKLKIQAIAEASIDGFLEFNRNGKILAVNDTLAEMTGYSREELLRMSLFDVEANMSSDQIKSELGRLATGEPVRFHSKWRTRHGKEIDIAVGAKYVKTPDEDRFLSYIRDIGPELDTYFRIEKLTLFYRFLSNVNASIFTSTHEEQIYSTITEYAVKEGGFALAWAGILDEQGGKVLPKYAYGVAAEYVKELVITTDPALPTSHGPTRMAMVQNIIVHTDDFQNDTRTVPWHDLGRQYGLNSSAAVPIVLDGKAVAALTFYSSRKGYFDQEMREALQEVARNASLALQALYSNQKLSITETALRTSDERFKQIFEASPVPMQLYSLKTRKLLAINRAHQQTFGYLPAEIPDEESWFEKTYPDKDYRQTLMELWNNDLHKAHAGDEMNTVTSPPISLRCKDGSECIAQGSMSITGDNVIIQWQDLTEIKRSESLLLENERRFRSMVEQTITGIYVTQNNKLAYINPRMAEILGWSADEMLGKDSLQFFAHDPDSEKKVLEARSQLYSGAGSTSLNLSCRRKDGKEIILGVHATMGYWNGGPAIIVMAQDITERQRAEEKIRQYIKQLEGTMEGTLRAVANMVDQRDPYTSGHERRVGIIAADIAHEMGWPEEKCNSLRLIGLVHDIGKIGVPSEILTKPTRLTALEYEMVKSHAEKGYEILRDVEFPLPIAEIIREHHERMDGSGYPQGLKGEEILLEARIIAVADVLESMASHRPYRPALGMDVALKEITSHSGIWFDADVVNALMNLVHKKNYQLPT